MEDRQCNVCNVIKDAIHTLCQCKKFYVLRDQMYETIIKKLKISKTVKEIFIDILTCVNTHLKSCWHVHLYSLYYLAWILELWTKNIYFVVCECV